MYWLPITWEEHTLASILSNLLGWPIALVLGLSAGIIVFAAFYGLILQALLTAVIMAAAAFMGSAIDRNLKNTSSSFYWSCLQVKRKRSYMGTIHRIHIVLHYFLHNLLLYYSRI